MQASRPVTEDAAATGVCWQDNREYAQESSSLLLRRSLMTLKSEVAELRYKVAELSSGELRLTFTTVKINNTYML